MAKVKIKTLSSVHIGSGNFLRNNIDFVTCTEGDDWTLNVIDDRKILELIGEENLDKWVCSIERGEDIKRLMKIYSPKSEIADYTQSSMDLFADVNENDTLKEHIRDGMGRIYIPGSSLKGAIRTAIVTTLARNLYDAEKLIIKDKKIDRWSGEEKITYAATKVEQKLFGNDPNHDLFRFLRVGDAKFKKGSEIATRLVMYLNITKKKELHPETDTKPQLIEAIREGETAMTDISLDLATYQIASDNYKVSHLPVELSSLNNIFRAINNHTKALIEEEIDYWSNFHDKDADEYVEKLNNILDEIDIHSDQSCVLRLGHGSGWDFITGGWSRNLENFDAVVDASRPGNQTKYSDYDFPKSRRLEEDASLMGFVKLSIV